MLAKTPDEARTTIRVSNTPQWLEKTKVTLDQQENLLVVAGCKERR
jgi:hypothetical protein